MKSFYIFYAVESATLSEENFICLKGNLAKRVWLIFTVYKSSGIGTEQKTWIHVNRNLVKAAWLLRERDVQATL
jgi:hypothetical protein